jgi:hypothetical protein
MDSKAVMPDYGIPRNLLLKDLLRIAAYRPKSERFTGQLEVDTDGVVIVLTAEVEDVRRNNVVVAYRIG